MTRVIAGTARGRRLAVPGAGTRPTADRVREAVFSAVTSELGSLGGARVRAYLLEPPKDQNHGETRRGQEEQGASEAAEAGGQSGGAGVPQARERVRTDGSTQYATACSKFDEGSVNGNGSGNGGGLL